MSKFNEKEIVVETLDTRPNCTVKVTHIETNITTMCCATNEPMENRNAAEEVLFKIIEIENELKNDRV